MGQSDGNLVIYRQDTGHQAIWSTHTDDADTAKAEFRFQVDGNLVEYRTLYTRNALTNAIEGTEDGVAWASNQFGDLDEGIFLVMQNDGNLVKYSRDKVAKWNSGSDQGIGGNAELGSNYCVPTHAPVAAPTHAPSNAPVAHPTHTPTKAPISSPTHVPTLKPSGHPSLSPTLKPISAPTDSPTSKPISEPTDSPLAAPTFVPTFKPTAFPTEAPKPPTHSPVAPTHGPTQAPVAPVVPEVVPEPAPSVDESPSIGSGDNNYCSITFTKGTDHLTAPKGCTLFAVDDLSFLKDGETTKAFYACADSNEPIYITPDELTRVGLMEDNKSKLTSIYPGSATFVTFYTEADFSGYSYTYNQNYHHELTHFHFEGTNLGNDAIHSIKVSSLSSSFSLPEGCEETFKL